MIELLNCDCMEYMATVPDKYFDLAIASIPLMVLKGLRNQVEQLVLKAVS